MKNPAPYHVIPQPEIGKFAVVLILVDGPHRGCSGPCWHVIAKGLGQQDATDTAARMNKALPVQRRRSDYATAPGYSGNVILQQH